MPRQIGELLLAIDLRPPLRQDGFELAQRLVIRGNRGGLLFVERSSLRRGGLAEANAAGAARKEDNGEDGKGREW